MYSLAAPQSVTVAVPACICRYPGRDRMYPRRRRRCSPAATRSGALGGSLGGAPLSAGAMRLSGGGISLGSVFGNFMSAGEPLPALAERGGGGSGDAARYGSATGLDAAGLHNLHATGLHNHSSVVAVDGDATAQPEGPKMHACRNCQRAKTACMGVRPCPRCLRLGISCDSDAKAVKRACASCKRAKVKCDLDTQVSQQVLVSELNPPGDPIIISFVPGLGFRHRGTVQPAWRSACYLSTTNAYYSTCRSRAAVAAGSTLRARRTIVSMTTVSHDSQPLDPRIWTAGSTGQWTSTGDHHSG